MVCCRARYAIQASGLYAVWNSDAGGSKDSALCRSAWIARLPVLQMWAHIERIRSAGALSSGVVALPCVIDAAIDDMRECLEWRSSATKFTNAINLPTSAVGIPTRLTILLGDSIISIWKRAGSSWPAALHSWNKSATSSGHPKGCGHQIIAPATGSQMVAGGAASRAHRPRCGRKVALRFDLLPR